MKATTTITGLDHVSRVLSVDLPNAVKRRAVAGALRESAKPMVKAAKTGYLLGGSNSLSIAMAAWRSRKSEARNGQTFASVEIGPRRSSRKAIAAYFAYYGRALTPRAFKLGIRHAHLVEFGTAHSAPKRILSKVFSSGGSNAVRTFNRIIGERIEREALKAAQRQKK